MNQTSQNTINKKSISSKINIEKTDDNLDKIKQETVEKVLNNKNKDFKNVHEQPADEQSFENNV